MYAKFLLSAVLASTAAVAMAGSSGEVDPQTQYAIQVTSSRSRAEVQAEAAQVPPTRNIEPAGSRVYVPAVTSLDPLQVRQQTVQALRARMIQSGEASF
jgi:hypothetical protein